MLEALQQGFLGLFLYLSQLVGTPDDQARLSFVSATPVDARTVRIECRMDFTLNRQIEELIDAGVPLRFRMSAVTDRSDTAAFVRTLAFNVADYTYTIADSGTAGVRVSRPYPMILLACRDFGNIEATVPADAQLCRVEARILPSRVTRLNRMLDMSRMWGREKTTCLFDPQEKLREKGRK